MKKIVLGLVAGLLIATLVFAVFILLKPKPSTRGTALSESFKSIAELSVEEYYFKDIAKIDESAQIFDIDLPFTQKKILLTYEGKVKAGIRNFEDLEVSLEQDTQKVIIKAPEVEVLDAVIDNSSVEIYDESSNIFNPVKAGDASELLAGQQTEAKDRALEAGILDRAKTRAEEILKSHVESVLSGTQEEGYTVEVQWAG